MSALSFGPREEEKRLALQYISPFDPLFSRLLPASIGKAQTAKKRGAEKFATSVDKKVNGITKASKVW